MRSVVDVEVLASVLGCKAGSFPTAFGLSLGAKHKSVGAWDGVEEHLITRLTLWRTI